MKDELAEFLASEKFDVKAPFVGAIGMDCGSSSSGCSSTACGSYSPWVSTACGTYRVDNSDSNSNSSHRSRLKDSLSSHRKHCKARKGHCPYEKEEKKKQDSDNLSSSGDSHYQHKVDKHTSKAKHYLEDGNVHKAMKHLSKAQYYMNLINGNNRHS